MVKLYLSVICLLRNPKNIKYVAVFQKITRIMEWVSPHLVVGMFSDLVSQRLKGHTHTCIQIAREPANTLDNLERITFNYRPPDFM